jgi:serine protein kinase
MSSTPKADYLDLIKKRVNPGEYRELHWEGGLKDYLELIQDHPLAVRNAYQRMYDMVLSYGSEPRPEVGEDVAHYRFFDDPMDKGKDAIFGLDEPLSQLVSNIKSAAYGFGVERRVLLLHGPVGSSKSTIARLMKKGLQAYSRSREGALYTFGWQVEDDGPIDLCPMHEEPLLLVPQPARTEILADLNRRRAAEYRLNVVGDLCPFCRWHFAQLLEQHQDWLKVIQHVRVRRLLLSEKDRVGIGTFQPKDEKNQDSTELTGDINYRKIASSVPTRSARVQLRRRVQRREPRHDRVHRSAEARRGVPLRPARRQPGALDQAEEVRADDIDEVIIGHTNEPEYKAAEQRADGGVPRPHDQDRRAVQHCACTTRSRSTRRTSPGAASASTSRRTRSKSRRCGRS